jgi:hypothetical protein
LLSIPDSLFGGLVGPALPTILAKRGQSQGSNNGSNALLLQRSSRAASRPPARKGPDHRPVRAVKSHARP